MTGWEKGVPMSDRIDVKSEEGQYPDDANRQAHIAAGAAAASSQTVTEFMLDSTLAAAFYASSTGPS